MGGIAQLINGLVDLLGVHLAPWAVPAFLVAVLVLFSPMVRANLRTEDARKLLKRAARERGEERERTEAEALGLVRGRAHGLVVVAEIALEQGRRDLAARAVADLRSTQKLLPKLRKLERALEPPLPAIPSEACLLIERLVETGMQDEARARLALARRKWPFDDELEALEARLSSATGAAAT